MTRRYHTHTLQTNPWHRKEEAQSTNSHMTSSCNQSKANSSQANPTKPLELTIWKELILHNIPLHVSISKNDKFEKNHPYHFYQCFRFRTKRNLPLTNHNTNRTIAICKLAIFETRWQSALLFNSKFKRVFAQNKIFKAFKRIYPLDLNCAGWI